MKLYEYFSFKTLFYFLKDDSIFKTTEFKESYIEDENGLPAKKYTQEMLENLCDERFDHDNDMVVIKTKYGSFVYHKADEPKYAKKMLEKFSKNKPCGVFGSYRTTDVYTFGIAKNGKVERYVYTADDDILNEGTETEFEKTHPFKLLGEEETKPEDVDYIDEEYIFEIAKWFAGFDIETKDVKILDIKVYTPCKWNGELEPSAPMQITKNLTNAGVDSIGIAFSHNTADKSVTISCENVTDDGNRHVIYCDEVSFVKNKKELTLSLKRCLQALTNLDLGTSHQTMFGINGYYSHINNKDSNIAFILVDTEKKFMIGTSTLQFKGRRLPTQTNYIPYTNLFYDLSESTLKALVKQTINLIK